MNHIKNPGEWGMEELKRAAHGLKLTGERIVGREEDAEGNGLVIRQMEKSDLKDVLKQGLSDFGACFACCFPALACHIVGNLRTHIRV